VTVLLLYGFLAAIAAIVLFALFVFVLPKGEQISEAVPDSAPWALPAEDALRADDLVTLRLPVGLRGYRFAETDMLLDRLADELRKRETEIKWLRGGRIGPDPSLPLPPELSGPLVPPVPPVTEASPAPSGTHDGEPAGRHSEPATVDEL